MYQPAHFVEDRPHVLHALIRTHPLGLLISGGAAGLQANAIPFLLDADHGPHGRLRAHVARANPQWRALAEAPDALVVFQGPQAYVSPGWYASKAEHGKVVPTWNYAVVQARGRARSVEDADWLAALVSELTTAHESGRSRPWAVTDAPERYIAAQLRGIVGIEIEIAEIAGKWKVSQNRSEADRAGAAEGLSAEARPDAATMAALVRGDA